MSTKPKLTPITNLGMGPGKPKPKPTAALRLTLIDQKVNTSIDRRSTYDHICLYKQPALPTFIGTKDILYIPRLLNAQPADLFKLQQNLCGIAGYRFINKRDDGQMLIFVDGECLNSGAVDGSARGACSVVLTGREYASPIKHPLENDSLHPHTDDRANLRAALLGIGLSEWYKEGFASVVIATSSEYVVNGISRLVKKWEEDGWVLARGKGKKKEVANKDVWLELVRRVREVEKCGVEVRFWFVPKGWNEAVGFAREALEVSMMVFFGGREG